MKKVFFLILLLVLFLPSAAMAFEPIDSRGGALLVGSTIWAGYKMPHYALPKLSSIEEKGGKAYVTQTFKDFSTNDEKEANVYFYAAPKKAVFNQIKIVGDGGKPIEFKLYEKGSSGQTNLILHFNIENNKSITVSFSFSTTKKP